MNEPLEPCDATGPRVAVLGLFGSPNFGNEATLAAFLHNVSRRLPGVQFVCIGPRRSLIEREYGIPLIPIDVIQAGKMFWRVKPAAVRHFFENAARRAIENKRRRSAVELLDGVQQLVVPGTGMIDDFGQSPLDLPTDLDRWTWAAQQCGVPVTLLSVGVSRVQARESASLFRRALGRTSYLSFRDSVSAANARSMGLATSECVVPDLAFGLPSELIPECPIPAEARTIGFGVMGYYGWNQGAASGRRIFERYLSKVVACVCSLLASGRIVTLMTGDSRADDATVSRVVQECRARGAPMGSLRAPPIRNYRDLLAVIAQVQVVVASRFHNVLLALMLERPTISIGYSDKNNGVMGQFGLRSLCHDIDDFRVEQVLEQVEEIGRDPGKALRGFAQNLSAVKSSVEAQFDAVCEDWRNTHARRNLVTRGSRPL